MVTTLSSTTSSLVKKSAPTSDDCERKDGRWNDIGTSFEIASRTKQINDKQ